MHRHPTIRRLLLLPALVGTTLLSFIFVATQANAAPMNVVAHAGVVMVTGPHGERAGWVSQTYLKAHPDAIPGIKVTFPSNGPVVPDSASGCDLDVCIEVDGASTTVTGWVTTAYGNTGCANAYFAWNQGYYVGPTVCPSGSGSGVYYDSTGPTGYFPNGDQLCNYWYNGPPGEPCEYILA
jgi:hypothetical protein